MARTINSNGRATKMSDQHSIGVFSVDDHPLLREGTSTVVNSQPDMQVIAEAANGGEAIRGFREHHPDVTLMDLRLVSEVPLGTMTFGDDWGWGAAKEEAHSSRAPLEEFVLTEPVAPIAMLSASLVHDLRNPIAAISAAAELLIDMDLPCAHSKRLALNLYRSSRRVEQILQELVNFLRGSRQASEDCKLADIIQNALEQISDAAESQGIHLEVVASSCIQLRLERKRTEGVLLNLMINALEAMPAGGRLRISAWVEHRDVIVEVDDTGCGIPDLVRSKLFQPFVSGGKTNGIGLGLALSRNAVVEQGGDLWLGEKIGTGTLFCLRLPLARLWP
jgi:signal transduction histidine kinase